MGTSIHRRLFAISLAVIWCLCCTAATSIMGWAGPTLGWLFAGIAYLPGLAGAALVWGGRLLSARLAVATALALTLGGVCWYTMPPSDSHIRDMAADVSLPDGWTVVESPGYGDEWCMEECPYVEYHYAVDPRPSYGEAREALAAALREQGWTVTDGHAARGRWLVTYAKPVAEPDATIVATFGSS